MKLYRIFKLLFVLVFLTAGCATTAKRNPAVSGTGQTESTQEAVSAMRSVTEAVSGRKLSDAELKELELRIRKDKEAQSAIRSITGSLQETGPVLKYCPIDGKRYSPRLKYCPIHKDVLLKDVE